MLIKFLCPNGHPLSTSADRAGKPGQCPKCGIKFLVPEADEAQDAGGADDAQSAGRDTIEFLCPNGHQLSGPSSMQGKPGQCPHCGVKFLVPTYDDEPAESEVEEVVDVEEIEEVAEVEAVQAAAAYQPAGGVPGSQAGRGSAVGRSGAAGGLDFLASLEAQANVETPTGEGSTIGPVASTTVETPIVSGSDVHRQPPLSGGSSPSGAHGSGAHGSGAHGSSVQIDGAPAAGGSGAGQSSSASLSAAAYHPLAGVFARFWKQRGKHGVVEMHLTDGKVVTPKQFSARLSQPQFGVFAVEDSDGTFAVVTIPWASVAQLHLRGLKKLPPGVFE